MNAPASSPNLGGRPAATTLRTQPRRTGGLAWVALVQLALALLLGSPAVHRTGPHPLGTAPGVRARDAVELAFTHRRGDSAHELAVRLRHAPQTRAASGAAPFIAAQQWNLAPAAPSTEPVQAAAPDPRSARRPAYYANAPPLPVRLLT
ncbi:MAG TPA: hypothetical protein VFJ16_30735 [Longimicrobium sp.]|nr:hypothetical protein [Longimicrobium sp.]